MSAPLTQPVATIAAGASLSNSVYIGYGEFVAFLVGATWDAADITVQASLDGVTYYEVKDDNAGVLTLKAAAGIYVYMRTRLAIGPWIKLRSGTSGSVVNQTVATTLTLLVRKFPTPTVRGD